MPHRKNSLASIAVPLISVGALIVLLATLSQRTMTARAALECPTVTSETAVLAYTAAPAPKGNENRFTLRLNGANLELLNSQTRAILRSNALAATRSVDIKGADGETNDTLTIDFSCGMFNVPEGIHYDGGVGGYDTLVIAGGTAANERYDMKNANDGVVTLDDLRVEFSNIEPISDTGAAANFVINGTAAGETINIIDGPVVGGFQTTQVNSGGSATFELVNFANKTNVTVNGLSGDDTATLNVTTPAVGLSKLVVDGGNDPGDQASVTNFSLPGGTLSLKGFASIAQTGPIVVANVAAQGGFVSLTNSSNSVATLAGTTNQFVQFGFQFANSVDLNIGTVDGIVGIQCLNLQFGDVVLNGAAGKTLTVSQPITTTNGRMLFTFDDMAINAAVTAPALGLFGPTLEGLVTLVPFSAARAIDVGTDTGGKLGLTNLELSKVTAGTKLIIGDQTTDTGGITVSAPITAPSGSPGTWSTLELRQNGAFTASGPGSLTVANLLFTDGTASGHTWTINSASVTESPNSPIPYLGTTNLTVTAGSGSDTFNATPSSTTTFNINGGNPTPPASPGDTLNVTTAGTTNRLLTKTSGPSGFQGNYTFGNRQPVNFTQMETLNPSCLSSPAITCPGGITKFVDSGQNTATFNPSTPVVTGGCSPSVTGVRSDGKPLNAPYPIGVTIVTWTVTDANGDTASCSQSIGVMVPSGQRRRP